MKQSSYRLVKPYLDRLSKFRFVPDFFSYEDEYEMDFLDFAEYELKNAMARREEMDDLPFPDDDERFRYRRNCDLETLSMAFDTAKKMDLHPIELSEFAEMLFYIAQDRSVDLFKLKANILRMIGGRVDTVDIHRGDEYSPKEGWEFN